MELGGGAFDQPVHVPGNKLPGPKKKSTKLHFNDFLLFFHISSCSQITGVCSCASSFSNNSQGQEFHLHYLLAKTSTHYFQYFLSSFQCSLTGLYIYIYSFNCFLTLHARFFCSFLNFQSAVISLNPQVSSSSA